MCHFPSPPPTLTRAQVRALDAAAATELAIPTLLLMEHAAASLAQHALQLLHSITPQQNSDAPDLALLFCGPGNNGGDGYALARLLHLKKIPVHIIAVGPPPSPTTDAGINHAIAQRLVLPITPMTPANQAQLRRDVIALIEGCRRTVLVDALLGTGASRPLDGAMSGAVRTINELRAAHDHTRTLAVDIPTGMDADTGLSLENKPFSAYSASTPPPIVKADLTVTLAAMKPGLMRDHAAPWTGRIEVGDIGLPQSFIRRFAMGQSDAH